MVTEGTIKQIITKLVDTYHPSDIYLFGSYAWGKPDSESDFDIVIVIEHSDEKFYKRPIKGYRALRGLKIPADILVYTIDEFNNLSNNLTTLCYKIKKEGRKLYEAA
jgi:predicted nucleotidyltransferase